jgi:hypothetical protein
VVFFASVYRFVSFVAVVVDERARLMAKGLFALKL